MVELQQQEGASAQQVSSIFVETKVISVPRPSAGTYVSPALVPEPGHLRSRLYAVAVTTAPLLPLGLIASWIRFLLVSTAIRTRVNLAIQVGRRALLTKSVGAAEYLAEPRLIPRRGSSAWLFWLCFYTM